MSFSGSSDVVVDFFNGGSFVGTDSTRRFQVFGGTKKVTKVTTTGPTLVNLGNIAINVTDTALLNWAYVINVNIDAPNLYLVQAIATNSTLSANNLAISTSTVIDNSVLLANDIAGVSSTIHRSYFECDHFSLREVLWNGGVSKLLLRSSWLLVTP